MGWDSAGTVIEVGSSVSTFKVGDRVLGLAYGMEKQRNTNTESAFQHYTVLHAHMCTPIPSSISFESASVLPLALSTAAVGLFQADQLALSRPTLNPSPKGETVLIWGGSTSVGCCAIQLAAAAGYEVITTCSPKNFTLVKSLGAGQAFDYRSPNVVADLIAAFANKTSAGALTMGNGGVEAAISVLSTVKKGKKYIAMASFPSQDPKPTRFVLPRFGLFFLSWTVSTWVKSKSKGVGYGFFVGGTLVDNGLGKYIFEEFLPTALERGMLVPSPEAVVVGEGLEAIQSGVETLRKGVSAKKLVVTL